MNLWRQVTARSRRAGGCSPLDGSPKFPGSALAIASNGVRANGTQGTEGISHNEHLEEVVRVDQQAAGDVFGVWHLKLNSCKFPAREGIITHPWNRQEVLFLMNVSDCKISRRRCFFFFSRVTGPYRRTCGPPSTSCPGGVLPSAPCAVHRFNKDVATALAVAQARMALHLIRHACSHECRFLPGTSLGQLAQE